jgi:hypothetical protein
MCARRRGGGGRSAELGGAVARLAARGLELGRAGGGVAARGFELSGGVAARRLQHGEPDGVAGARDLVRAQSQLPVA